MKSLRSQIREIVDAAEHALPLGAIHGAMPRKCSRRTVAATVTQMLNDRQLRKRKAPKSQRTHGTQYVYGPGAKPVEEIRGGWKQHSKGRGFMALKRQREART